MPADDRLRGLFDELGGVAEPTDAQRDSARRQLSAAMRAEADVVAPWWRRIAIGWSAAALVAAAVVAFVLIVPTTTRSVDANLAEIAAAARTVDELSLPQGSYIYYRAESSVLFANETEPGRSIRYLLPTTQDLWVSGSSELSRTTTDPPTFFSSADEAAFYASSLPETEGIGVTRSQSLDGIPNDETVAGLADDADQLWDQIIDRLSVDPDFTVENEAEILRLVAQLLGPRLNAPPALRGALLEVLGRLDVSTSRTDRGGVMLIQIYEDEFGSFEQKLEFDRDGYLIRDVLILVDAFDEPDFPVGVIQDIRYTRPVVVSEPGLLPPP